MADASQIKWQLPQHAPEPHLAQWMSMHRINACHKASFSKCIRPAPPGAIKRILINCCVCTVGFLTLQGCPNDCDCFMHVMPNVVIWEQPWIPQHIIMLLACAHTTHAHTPSTRTHAHTTHTNTHIHTTHTHTMCVCVLCATHNTPHTHTRIHTYTKRQKEATGSAVVSKCKRMHNPMTREINNLDVAKDSLNDEIVNSETHQNYVSHSMNWE